MCFLKLGTPSEFLSMIQVTFHSYSDFYFSLELSMKNNVEAQDIAKLHKCPQLSI